MPTKQNFKIYQGSTFDPKLRWESPVKGYAPITAITRSAPVVITSNTHTIPIGWRVRPTNILGMTELNSAENTYYTVSETSINTVTINSINSLGFKDYVSGGVLEYNVPVDLTGFTARMQLREKLESEVVLLELTTVNGKIVIDNVLKTISLLISATETASLEFSQAVYSLELISSGGVVTTLCFGNISVTKEVTR